MTLINSDYERNADTMKNKKCRLRILCWTTVIIGFISFYSCGEMPVDEYHHEDPKEVLPIAGLAVVERIAIRQKSEDYYAFMTSANRVNLSVKPEIHFTIFNPFRTSLASQPAAVVVVQEEILKNVTDAVSMLVDLKKRLSSDRTLVKEVFGYIESHPGSPLAKAYHDARGLMESFDFLVIEPVHLSVAHPLYWDQDTTTLDAFGATVEDAIETTYGLFLVKAAFDQGKPMWGACHGSDLGYLFLGGRLTKIFHVDKLSIVPTPRVLGKTNPFGGPDEIWSIKTTVHNRPLRSDKVYRVFGNLKYPFPEVIAREFNSDQTLFINKEFSHSLALTSPIPEILIDNVTYHPLSMLDRDDPDILPLQKIQELYPDITSENLEYFYELFIQMPIIDFYNHKTIYGTQYHPQYTYNDYDTSLFFDFLVKQITLNKLNRSQF